MPAVLVGELIDEIRQGGLEARAPRGDGGDGQPLVDHEFGAPGRNRTSTPLPATDFESAASTSSATGAHSRSRGWQAGSGNQTPRARGRILGTRGLSSTQVLGGPRGFVGVAGRGV